MGSGQMCARRRSRQLAEAYDILKPLNLYPGPQPDGIIQCGLGDWAEGQAVLAMFGQRQMLAIEPLQRYCFEAWRDGFRGPIIQGALWHTAGKLITLQDFRTRTSMLDTESRRGPVEARTLTLDDAVKYVNYRAGRVLLWMDIEGVELEVLKGAAETLKRTVAIVCELKDEPRMANWPNTNAVISQLASLGYTFMTRIADNGLFYRNDYVARCCDPLLGC